MYEVKIEFPNEAPVIKRNLQRPEAANQVLLAATFWVEKCKGQIGPQQTDEDGPLVIELLDQDGKVVGKASAYEQAQPSRQITGKYKDLQKLVRQHIQVDHMTQQVMEMIDEVLDPNQWPDDTLFSLNATAGEYRATPGFWRSEFLMHEIVSGFTGRYIRKLTGMAGLNPSDLVVISRSLPIVESTNKTDVAVTKRIMQLLDKKYPAPEGFDQAKIDALVEKANQGIEKGLHDMLNMIQKAHKQ